MPAPVQSRSRVRGGLRSHLSGFAIVAVWPQPTRDPFPPPPPIFDLLLAIVLAWGGWRVWKKGRGWRSGAIVLWLLALAGLYTYIRSFGA